MNRPPKFVPFQFLPHRRVKKGKPPEGTLWIDVSSYADAPYDQLSPFYPHGGIPIPGMDGKTSDCVEGIWQGLKVIRGEIAPRFFRGGGRKRGGKPAGHRFGESKRLLDIVEARQKIYVPAYEWTLEHRVEPALIEELIGRAFQGVVQCLYDMENNGSIANRNAPLAHASVLASYLNRKCAERSGA